MQSDDSIELSVTTCTFVCLTHSEAKHSQCRGLSEAERLIAGPGKEADGSCP